ncbi:DUF6155 family protein [Flavobacterium rhizosphaerae]|uniref:DUF6155 family protein n=1 Tax=Flavobacterium rhizosphaerae TaxID=3163298 RepID=A0ABW8YZA2_9FLAO
MKRQLKKYVASLPKEALEEQLISLYEKFGDVKAYYDFVFNPKEDKLEQEAKLKIANEYFPVKSKRAKLRRSVAQKYIKHFLSLGVDPFIIADIMLYNIEIAQQYSAERAIRYSSFYKSMYNSYKQAAEYVTANGMAAEYKSRIAAIFKETLRQRWENRYDFEQVYDNFE